ncbi:MAG: hypothetical protein IPN32_11510 [Deltaproteobacteria bacterium]|nr:hypothetical protein [Deltaproteobacteria bacterium]
MSTSVVIVGLSVWSAVAWLVSATALAGISVIVARRWRARFGTALREEVAPHVGELPPQQALAVLSALHGRALASPLLERVAELEQLAATQPAQALAGARELVAAQPRAVPALSLCARLEFALHEPTAAATWTRAIAAALRVGANAAAARELEAHAEQREALGLSQAELRALAKALAARGAHEQAAWCEARAADD